MNTLAFGPLPDAFAVLLHGLLSGLGIGIGIGIGFYLWEAILAGIKKPK